MSDAPVAQGTLCISIDVELAWGVWDQLSSQYMERCLRLERSIVNRLLALFAEYDVAATWAIVGHLLRPRHDVPADSLPAWYAPDLVEAIRRAHPRQEIGSHSFAHPCYPDLSAAAAREDLEAAASAHREYGLPFESFVFPRNLVAYSALLARTGLRVCRTVDRGWHMRVARLDARLGRAANLADKVLPLRPATVVPRRGIHLTEIETSMLLIGRDGLRRLVHPRMLVAKASLGLRAAVRRGRVFHLWFHPSNFYYDGETQFEILRRILDEARGLVRGGQLRIESMGALAT
jgi:peptidoglycan/xylan/chitin deacetylase (PgdA/CDA1 family)